jgi:hypothetical protein
MDHVGVDLRDALETEQGVIGRKGSRKGGDQSGGDCPAHLAADLEPGERSR